MNHLDDFDFDESAHWLALLWELFRGQLALSVGVSGWLPWERYCGEGWCVGPSLSEAEGEWLWSLFTEAHLNHRRDKANASWLREHVYT